MTLTEQAAYIKGLAEGLGLDAEKPDTANRLYEYFCERLSRYAAVEKGIFGADMKVGLVNDGPITIVMDSEKLK